MSNTKLTIKGYDGVTHTGIRTLLESELNKEHMGLLNPDIKDDGPGLPIQAVTFNTVYPEYFTSKNYQLDIDVTNTNTVPCIVIDLVGNRDTHTIKYEMVINGILSSLGFKLTYGSGIIRNAVVMEFIPHKIE